MFISFDLYLVYILIISLSAVIPAAAHEDILSLCRFLYYLRILNTVQILNIHIKQTLFVFYILPVIFVFTIKCDH